MQIKVGDALMFRGSGEMYARWPVIVKAVTEHFVLIDEHYQESWYSVRTIANNQPILVGRLEPKRWWRKQKIRYLSVESVDLEQSQNEGPHFRCVCNRVGVPYSRIRYGNKEGIQKREQDD